MKDIQMIIKYDYKNDYTMVIKTDNEDDNMNNYKRNLTVCWPYKREILLSVSDV
jgi:hypothetical protein